MSYFWLLVHHTGFFITFLRCSSYLVHKLCVLCSDIWTSFLEPSLKVHCYSVSKLDRHLSLLLNLAYDTQKKSGMEKVTHIFCGGRQCLPCFTSVIHNIQFVYFNLLNYSLTHRLDRICVSDLIRKPVLFWELLCCLFKISHQLINLFAWFKLYDSTILIHIYDFSIKILELVPAVVCSIYFVSSVCLILST